MATAQPHPCVAVAATDPLYILYTSGTTGEPKGVVRDNGGHAVALKWSMRNIYGVEPGEVGKRYGARGNGPSMYIRDPDGNVVELKGPPQE